MAENLGGRGSEMSCSSSRVLQDLNQLLPSDTAIIQLFKGYLVFDINKEIWGFRVFLLRAYHRSILVQQVPADPTLEGIMAKAGGGTEQGIMRLPTFRADDSLRLDRILVWLGYKIVAPTLHFLNTMQIRRVVVPGRLGPAPMALHTRRRYSPG